MAFKVGGTTIIDSYGSHILNSNNGNYVGSGIYYNNFVGYEQAIRYTSGTDDHATNCRGYLPGGNCNANSSWDAPNGNWWTWGASGISTSLCGNPTGYDFHGGRTSAYYAVSVAYVYDGYYTLYDRVRGLDNHRNYSHCNCNSGLNSIGNCYSNCNCACDCDCNCACACACNC